MAMVAKRYPLVAFFGLVFAAQWVISPILVGLSPMALGLMALIPAPAALAIAGLVGGRPAVVGLLRRSGQWRMPVRWYALAIAVPTAIHLLAAGLSLALGGTPQPRWEFLLAYAPVTLLLAAGEEIGWRGFALPRLVERWTPLGAVLVFGVLHAAFHLPMYLLPLPDELRQASPFWLFLPMATAFAFFSVWIFSRTAGNIPLGIVYHAAINTSVIFLYGVEREQMGWLLPAVWTAVALTFFAFGGWHSLASVRVMAQDRQLPGWPTVQVRAK